jgi:hypothetical protein
MYGGCRVKRETGFRRQMAIQKANAKLGDKAPTSNRHERRKAAKLMRAKR